MRTGRSTREPGRRWIVVMLLVAPISLVACGEAVSDEHEIVEQAVVEAIEGTDVARITLTESAAGRLDIQTTPVEEAGEVTVVPSAAVFVDPNGDFWVYTNPDPLVFVRQGIGIDHEEGGRAFLSDGPPTGTEVVTVGVAELYGAEYGVG